MLRSAPTAPPLPETPAVSSRPAFAFDNSYARALEGAYVAWKPAAAPAPKLLRLNRGLADELGLDPDALASPEGLAVLAGNTVPDGAQPIAQAYAGHQFGGFSPQLGDGRALLLGEVIDRRGERRDIAFKGSGRTPFSRGGDGKAALGPVLREYLMGEAMHALGIPTTRVLAAVATGEPVFRETVLPGALLARVAASHLRVGTFEFFAAREDGAMLRRLADYAIARHDPALADRDDRYLGLLEAVAERQAALVAQWVSVGFIHGVMNTDNMTISGETIDYGPCAFMEAYDPAAVFSSIDTQGRYAFGNQPRIARWNLARFAEALLPLLHEDGTTALALATGVIDAFPARFHAHWLRRMRAKLGIGTPPREGPAPADPRATDDQALIDDFLALLQAQAVDYTRAFRHLADAAGGDDRPLRSLFTDEAALSGWLARWRARLEACDDGVGSGDEVGQCSGEADGRAAARARAMRACNPLYLPRNHLVEEALAAAVEHDDLGPFERLLAAVEQPFDARADADPYAAPAPRTFTACYRTYCGT